MVAGGWRWRGEDTLVPMEGFTGRDTRSVNSKWLQCLSLLDGQTGCFIQDKERGRGSSSSRYVSFRRLIRIQSLRPSMSKTYAFVLRSGQYTDTHTHKTQHSTQKSPHKCKRKLLSISASTFQIPSVANLDIEFTLSVFFSLLIYFHH